MGTSSSPVPSKGTGPTDGGTAPPSRISAASTSPNASSAEKSPVQGAPITHARVAVQKHKILVIFMVAAAINAWRFSKLNENNEENIETENEAFDRYMQNVSLLEEAFFVNSSLEGLIPDRLHIPDSAALTSEDESQKFILGMKAKLKSNVAQADRCRQRIRDLLDRGLWKLQKCEFEESESADMVDANGERELRRPKKKGKWWAERTTAINDLIDTLNKTRSAEEL